MHPAWYAPKSGSTFVKQDDNNLVAAFDPAKVSPSMHGYRIRPDVTQDLNMDDIYEVEGVLFLLRKCDPEDWTVQDRVKVISFLCDFVMETKQFEAFVRPEQDGVAELEREDAKAGEEVDAAFSFGGEPREGSEHEAFSAWKKAAGANSVTPGEDMSCTFCKSDGPCGPAAARSPSGDSWVSCPVIMASEAPPSFEGFSGSQLFEVKDDKTSVLRVKEASMVAATKAAMAANRTEPCHESCLRSVWRGRRMSHAQELAIESTGGDLAKWTSRNLGRDRDGGQYFLLADELCRRAGENWSRVVDVEAFASGLDPDHCLEGILRRNLLLYVKASKAKAGGRLPPAASVLTNEIVSKTKLLAEAEEMLSRDLTPTARQEMQFAAKQLRVALRNLDYYSLYVSDYEALRNEEGEEAAGQYWQSYQLDFVDYTEVPFEGGAVGWLRPSYGQACREIRAETAAHRVLSTEGWYRRDKKPFPADCDRVNFPGNTFTPYAEIVNDIANGVQWQEVTGGYCGETYRNQPVLRLNVARSELLGVYPNCRAACLALECDEEERLGKDGRAERAEQRWKAKSEGIGNEVMLTANALGYTSAPVFGSSFVLAPHLLKDGARVQGWCVDHKGKPVPVKSEYEVMLGLKPILGDQDFVFVPSAPPCPEAKSSRAFHSMAMNSPPGVGSTVTADSVAARVTPRLNSVKAAVFNIYSCLPKGADHTGRSTAGIKCELGLSLHLPAWEGALLAASTPREVDLVLTALLKAIPGCWLAERFKASMFSGAGEAVTVAAVASKAYGLDRSVGANFQGAGAFNPQGRSSRLKKTRSVICNEDTLAGYLSLPVGPGAAKTTSRVAGGAGEGLRCCRNFTCGRRAGEHDNCGGRVGGTVLPTTVPAPPPTMP